MDFRRRISSYEALEVRRSLFKPPKKIGEFCQLLAGKADPAKLYCKTNDSKAEDDDNNFFHGSVAVHYPIDVSGHEDRQFRDLKVLSSFAQEPSQFVVLT